MVSGSLALLYFLLGFHEGRQGSGPDSGQSPVEWGDLPFVRPQTWLAGPQAWLDGPEGGMDGQTDVRTDIRMENLPILQDFVPYRGCCPASTHENQGERRAGQGNR